MWQEVYRLYFPVPGYRKSEADKHILEIDPVTAPMVRHAFDLCLQGYGFRKIVLTLNEEKIPSPEVFTTWQMDGKICAARRFAGAM
ncbi:MAG: recombinase family protein [Firmicutes bacterium]|nr:recombinase family protein [Bacillota bacterium]